MTEIKERIKYFDNDIWIFEKDIVEKNVTRDMVERINHIVLKNGQSIAEWVGEGLDSERLRWDEDDRLVPEYDVVAGLTLYTAEKEALRRKSLASGEMPDVILTRIINSGVEIAVAGFSLSEDEKAVLANEPRVPKDIPEKLLTKIISNGLGVSDNEKT